MFNKICNKRAAKLSFSVSTPNALLEYILEVYLMQFVDTTGSSSQQNYAVIILFWIIWDAEMLDYIWYLSVWRTRQGGT